MNDESILDTIKKMLGLADDYDAFDIDVVVDINAAMLTLKQLGVGPDDGYSITGPDEVWTDIPEVKASSLNAVKQYIYLKTRMLFDPPTTSAHIDAMKATISELEWRLTLEAEE